MAKPKLKISLAAIAKAIAKAEKALEKLETRVSDADKKKIKLEIKKFGKFNRELLAACRSRMTQVFAARMTGCPKKS
jgi:hypothetical protein